MQGRFGALELRDKDTLSGRLTTLYGLGVTQSGALVLTGQTAQIGGNLVVTDHATFTMQNGADSLPIAGSAVMRGGDGTGLATAGVMTMAQHLATMRLERCARRAPTRWC